MSQWATSCLFYRRGARGPAPDFVNRGRSKRASAWNHNPPEFRPPKCLQGMIAPGFCLYSI